MPSLKDECHRNSYHLKSAGLPGFFIEVADRAGGGIRGEHLKAVPDRDTAWNLGVAAG